jgi:hypothetical protein
MIGRPNCRNCGKPLEVGFYIDNDTGKPRTSWYCGNLSHGVGPRISDEKFLEEWKQLGGDDVVELIRIHPEAEVLTRFVE